MQQTFTYLSQEWASEAIRRLRQELTPEKMKYVTSSMLTVYLNCPDGKNRSLFYKFVDGTIQDLRVTEGEPPAAEFTITGDYQIFARISRAELNSRAALMSGRLRLKGNMVKALSLSSIVDRMNKVLSTIPAEY